MEVYEPGQLKKIQRWLPQRPRWLILGGPSCADEAQTARELWPDVRVLALEPNPVMVHWQLAHGFPTRDAAIIPHALSDQTGEATFWTVQGPRGGSLDPLPDEPGTIQVQTTTLDLLFGAFGFEDAILWLDVEGSELRALRGGERLLASGAVILINVETCDKFPDDRDAVGALLTGHGYRKAEIRKGQSGHHQDEVWIK